MPEQTPLEPWIQRKVADALMLGHREPLTRSLLHAYQLRKLKETIARVKEYSPYYRNILASLSDDFPHALADLKKFPFTTADDVRANPLHFVCCSQDDISRIVTLETSGTTGPRKRIFFTAEDQELTRDFFHNALSVVAREGDRVLVLLPGERPGSVGDLFSESALRLGVRPVAHGFVKKPRVTLEVMERERIDTLLGTPVQVLALAEYEPPGQKLFDIHIKNVILNTDTLPQSVRNRIEEKWGCRVFNHYAMTEMGLGGGLECEAQAGYHMREADFLFEVVNPWTGEVLPDDTEGEIVFTTLTRTGMPLLRYRTGDFGKFLSHPCKCGTVLKRIAPVCDRIDGRIDFGEGAWLSMSQLSEKIFSVRGVFDFRAVLGQEIGWDTLSIRVLVPLWVSPGLEAEIYNEIASIPVVAKRIRAASLRLKPILVERSDELWPPVKKMLADLRRKGKTTDDIPQ